MCPCIPKHSQRQGKQRSEGGPCSDKSMSSGMVYIAYPQGGRGTWDSYDVCLCSQAMALSLGVPPQLALEKRGRSTHSDHRAGLRQGKTVLEPQVLRRGFACDMCIASSPTRTRTVGYIHSLMPLYLTDAFRRRCFVRPKGVRTQAHGVTTRPLPLNRAGSCHLCLEATEIWQCK